MPEDIPHLILHAVTRAEMTVARRHSRSRSSKLGDNPGETPIRLAGRAVVLSRFDSMRLCQPFLATFEEVTERLQDQPGLYLEPDGSFVWVGQSGDVPGCDRSEAGRCAWQLDGQFHEAAGRVLHVELKGNCPASSFESLLDALGATDQPVLAQLVREARYVDAREWFGLRPSVRRRDR